MSAFSGDNNRPGNLLERQKAFQVRTAQYLRLGYDRFAAADFVIDAGGNLLSPALDIGTGKGLTAMALAKKGLDVISVDIEVDEQALAKFLAKEAGLDHRIKFICQNASELPYPDGYFRCVVLSDILHHLEDAAPVLKEADRVLTPQGIMIIADFSAEGFEIVARLHRADGHFHSVSGESLETAEQFLSARGFETTQRLSGHMQEIIVMTKKVGKE
ncbi:MAG TPA: class I SAM-dependent methyltransferase [Candidatus Marinimicrobia bacterium]|nr:class I SAM-dependent methyltransferase [Candidatus Neomarinimicrobiota bacterium]HQH56846.1 class I SAM-dependent methyltransferase [Candidatus Neomarinimicrobiota bacterium]HRS90437.1 class I SAM-dependent methyltransferase [Candidatus Neomarinimicrobiota bacterium]HRU45620.1 class I SAM-dependent methyltransferase [Candidatus Neomarinimicrobiota bacterium]